AGRPPEEIRSGGGSGTCRGTFRGRRFGFAARAASALRRRGLAARFLPFPVGPSRASGSAGGRGEPVLRFGAAGRNPLSTGVGSRIGVGGGASVACRASAPRLDGRRGVTGWLPGGTPHLLPDPLLELGQQRGRPPSGSWPCAGWLSGLAARRTRLCRCHEYPVGSQIDGGQAAGRLRHVLDGGSRRAERGSERERRVERERGTEGHRERCARQPARDESFGAPAAETLHVVVEQQWPEVGLPPSRVAPSDLEQGDEPPLE